MSLLAHYGTRCNEIEECARAQQLRLLHHDGWSPNCVSANPLVVLEPGVALNLEGYSIQVVDALGEAFVQGRRIEAAGLIDRSNRAVRVSRRFSTTEQRFTAAHELGHALLHPHGETFHRDRPMDPTGWGKSREEKEADWFAACFLMPTKQLKLWFRQHFLTPQFSLNDDTSFALCTGSIDRVLTHVHTRRDLSMLLATAGTYNGHPRRPLYSIFRVSPTAMAIRLEQLDLVDDPDFQRLRA